MIPRFTTKELAGMGLPGYPGTPQGWDKLVKLKGWEFTEGHGRGRGGVRREYMPPPEILTLIEARQRGELPPLPVKPAPGNLPLRAKAPEMALYRVAGQPSDPHGEIDELVLSCCLSACNVVHGDEFAKLSTAQQFGYAVDFYNLLVRMCYSQGVAIGDMKRLETKGLAEQLGAFVKLGWARKFPPPPNQVSCFF